jgi:hypothetical protein
VPPAFGTLTEAQRALANLLRRPQELLNIAAKHSKKADPAANDDFTAWIKLLPADRRNDFLRRLAHNEPGLSRLLVKELRELGQHKTGTTPPEAERIPYATLHAEYMAAKAKKEREDQERKEIALQSHLQDIYDHQDNYWLQIDQAVGRHTGAGYDEAVRLLVKRRDAARHFQGSQAFQERFNTWIQSHPRRPGLFTRLRDKKFIWSKT